MPENYPEPVGFTSNEPPDRLPYLTRREANQLIDYAISELPDRRPGRHVVLGLAAAAIAVVLGVAILLFHQRDPAFAAIVAAIVGTAAMLAQQELSSALHARKFAWLWAIADEYAFRLDQQRR